MNTDRTHSLRLFYALWPDDATRAALMQLQAPIHGRKTRYENIHLTLAFLGQQSADLLPMLKKILTRLPQTPLSFVFDRAGYFTRNRVAWAGMHQIPDPLIALHDNLTQELRQNNVEFDSRSAFRPHVTLARDATQPEDLPFEPVIWQADQVALVQSVTQPEGVLYSVIASRSLKEKF
jgi:2'-5' RNA ligase